MRPSQVSYCAWDKAEVQVFVPICYDGSEREELFYHEMVPENKTINYNYNVVSDDSDNNEKKLFQPRNQ